MTIVTRIYFLTTASLHDESAFFAGTRYYSQHHEGFCYSKSFFSDFVERFIEMIEGCKAMQEKTNL